MDVSATKVQVGSKKTVETSDKTDKSGHEVSVLPVGSNLFQEHITTSKLTSLLSSIVEPFAAAPRMPQQSGPRNTNEEEKAALPQPVATPSFSIPPHVMGRNIDNPVEDMVAHGRRLQKPRLGVRVPYRNLTSQIVTQDELAQELLERSLKKHPVHDTPEGGDIFFAIKLTQRLASRLSPSTTGGSLSVASDTGKTTHFQPSPTRPPQPVPAPPPPPPPPSQAPSSEPGCVLPEYALLSEPIGIPDHSDLLAILEGDVEPDWAPVTKSLPESSTRNIHYSHHTNTSKLDPVIEKELALKQLMEFQTAPKRRKADKTQAKSEKSPRKPRVRQSNDSGAKIKKEIISGDSTNNNGLGSEVKNNVNSQKKLTRRRKCSVNDSEVQSKRPKLSVKKAETLKITDRKKLFTQHDIKSAEVKFSKNLKLTKQPNLLQVKKMPGIHVVRCDDIINNTPSTSETSSIVTGDTGIQKQRRINSVGSPGNKKSLELLGKTRKSSDNSPTSRTKNVNVFNFYGKSDPEKSSNESSSGTNIESKTAPSMITLSSNIGDTTITDGLPEQPRMFASPLRTYRARKKTLSPGADKTGSLSPDSKTEQNSTSLRVDVDTKAITEQTTVECKVNVSTKLGPEASASKMKSEETPTKSRLESISPKSKSDDISRRSKGDSSVNSRMDEICTRSKVEQNTNKVKMDQSQTKIKTEPVTTRNIGDSKTGTSPNQKKIRRGPEEGKEWWNREMSRLLMDEGAINLLYEVEQGESRRRSIVSDDAEPVSKRSVRARLKSIQHKKKDLVLKTRLVRNAVLRLSSASSALAPVASRTKRRSKPPTLELAGECEVKHKSPQRKRSLDSLESQRSPPPLTPVDPPSPCQSFMYPPRLHLTAEASRIIRRHSSSSNFSSRSASPSNIRGSIDSHLVMDNAENKPDNQHDKTPSASTSGVTKQFSEPRKKGVPIFVRKTETALTYRGKKSKVKSEQFSGSENVLKDGVNSILETKVKELKPPNKVQSQLTQKVIIDSKKKVMSTLKKVNHSDKMKAKTEMSKNLQKNKVSRLKKIPIENEGIKVKKSAKGESNVKVSTVEDEMPDLSSCLAATASAFAAEAKAAKKTSGSSGTSLTSSPCPSRSSKSPTPSRPPLLKKEARIAPPLSPNAATYSNLIKTLENESQKQRKKDGEEAIKQRSSVRQNAGTFHYKEISLRRYDNLVQVILTPQSTKMKNALNLQVLRELRDALHQLKRDDTCRAVLLTSTGSSFCQGVDFHVLMHANAERRKTAAQELAQALKEFMKCLALFNKPIVAGVHGAAVGLGVTMLPFFDMVFASDKATFYTPYAKLGQVPEGAAILTLPHMFGNAVTSELLFGCRKLTASEALHFGLVTRILWPDRFQEELIPVIRSMANQSAQSMEATKALLRHSLRTKLDAALESESHLLVQHWSSAECQANFRRFLEDEDVGLQRQRLDA